MVSFSDLNITQLKKVIRFYRLHILKDITGYTKNNRDELIELCEKMFHINENGISLKVSNPIVFDIPKGRVIKPRKKREVQPKKEIVKVKKTLTDATKSILLDMLYTYYNCGYKGNQTKQNIKEKEDNIKRFKLYEIEYNFNGINDIKDDIKKRFDLKNDNKDNWGLITVDDYDYDIKCIKVHYKQLYNYLKELEKLSKQSEYIDNISPLEVVKMKSKELDEELNQYNTRAVNYHNEKNRISKEMFDIRKKSGEKMTRNKIETIKKNAVLKNPQLKQTRDELFNIIDDINERFRELGKWGLSQGLSYRDLSGYIDNKKTYDIQ